MKIGRAPARARSRARKLGYARCLSRRMIVKEIFLYKQLKISHSDVNCTMRLYPSYQRYTIAKKIAPHIVPHPHPFRVKIKRWPLFKLLIKELFKYWRHTEVLLSRPCAYGVFSGPLGGFKPREKLCVGCLRCTTQYPEIATILPNSAWQKMASNNLSSEQVDTITKEAFNGQILVKGAGYRGKFGGEGWDGVWTDMSEIVRPTRDGIYGREYISTEVRIGEKLPYISFDAQGVPTARPLANISIPFPMLFGNLPPPCYAHPHLEMILAQAARHLRTFTFFPFASSTIEEKQVIFQITPDEWENFKKKGVSPLIIELTTWHANVFACMKHDLPNTLVIVRLSYEDDLLALYQNGVRVFHLKSSEQERGEHGRFVFHEIRSAHLQLVKWGIRDTVTLLGGGEIYAAEHVCKAILAGLDAVVLTIPLAIALQAPLKGRNAFILPPKMPVAWGVQRLKNLMGAWQDQLFETAGAMGIREIRRMRGEIGRALLQKDLENEAFEGIDGYEHQ
jgi:hypothetical protein